MKIETIQLWDSREDVELTMFLHMPDMFIPNPLKKPALIVCPGGAYMSCPRHGNEGDPVAMTFAADGYQTFVLEYSVAEKSSKENVLFPSQILDLGKAFLTIRENADAWGVDVEKISIMGFSAGAHLSGMYATTWHEPLLADTFKVPTEHFKPLTAFLIYPLTDYVYQDEIQRINRHPMMPENLHEMTFGESGCTEGNLKKYSPAYRVTDKTPELFIAAAYDDGLVPSVHSLKLAQAMNDKGVPYELHMFRYGDHGFSLGRNLFEPFREDKKRVASEWVPLAKKFLMHKIAPDTIEWEKSPF